MKILLLAKKENIDFLISKIIENQKVEMLFILQKSEFVSDKLFSIEENFKSAEEYAEFVEANEIDFTVCLDAQLIKMGIKAVFDNKGLMIFASLENTLKIAYSCSTAKKFIYKNKIPTPKFRIEEKENSAIYNLRALNFPLIIRNEEYGKNKTEIFETYSAAKQHINKLFFENSTKVILEEFIPAKYLNYYIFSDENKFFPLPSVSVMDKNDDILWISPSQNLDKELEHLIIRKIIAPTLACLKQNKTPFKGLLGFEIAITENNNPPLLLSYYPEFQNKDMELCFSLLDEDILDILFLCSVGALSDETDKLATQDKLAITKLDKESKEIITASTISTALKQLKEDYCE